MDFARTEEQQELAATLRSLLAKRGGSAEARAAIASEAGFDAALWQTLCEQIGLAALAVPEEYDGVGASLDETATALEETARSLAPLPLLASSIATAALLLHGTDEQKADLLPRIAAGATATVVLEPPLVLEPSAEIVLVPSGDGLTISGTTPSARRALDPGLRLGHLDVPAEPSQELLDVAASLATAVQVGTAQLALDLTVAYAKERQQFGRPIGSFQALKHRMADLLVLVEMSRSASWAATGAAAAYVSEPTVERAATLRQRAAVAQAYCSEATETVAGEMIQLHGGIAITWEHDAHLLFKRAHALGQLFGAAHVHRAAVAL
jgi:alkylation response protein AidB-like acyl-CoA dehydrogenase